MILITSRNQQHSIKMMEMADEVWEHSDVDGNYTLVKIRHANHNQYNPGIIKTESELLAHIALTNASYPLTPNEVVDGNGNVTQWVPKTGRPGGGPHTLKRTQLRELLRTTYRQGVTDSGVVMPLISDSDIDKLISTFLEKT